MKAHGEQTRASGDPYFSHPLEVAAILTDLKLDDATIAAALLHDVIEDTEVTRDEIDQKFGKEIGELADRLHKMRKLGHKRPDSRRRTSDETLEIYAPLAGRMGMQGMREELEGLAFKWGYPEQHQAVVDKLAD